MGMGIPGGPRGGIIMGAGMPPMRAGEGPPTPRTGPDDRRGKRSRKRGKGKGRMLVQVKRGDEKG